MPTFTMRGAAAEIRWAYHRAAALASWAITTGPDGVTSLTATVASSDAFKVSQQPLTFRVPRPKGSAWQWPITLLQIDGETLRATLGPLEE